MVKSHVLKHNIDEDSSSDWVTLLQVPSFLHNFLGSFLERTTVYITCS